MPDVQFCFHLNSLAPAPLSASVGLAPINDPMNGTPNQESRPQRVSTAVALIYISLAIGVVRILMEASGLSQGAPLGFVLFVGFATLAVLLFFTTMIGKQSCRSLRSCFCFRRFLRNGSGRQKSLNEAPNPQRGANGRQPFRSGSIRMSGSAASRPPRWSLAFKQDG